MGFTLTFTFEKDILPDIAITTDTIKRDLSG